jgi:LPPG:FO 2-phospho-L-lactate transferase
MKVVALAGGVGGAKLVDGLAELLQPEELTVIVNTGDDFRYLGLKVCPDLDTVCYTLAGLANPQTGWGRKNETWHALETMRKLGGSTWFNLGDYDLGLHLERTNRLKNGDSLHKITLDFCKAMGVKPLVLPMTNDDVPTVVNTTEGKLQFQEYFVHRACEPAVNGFDFVGAAKATSAPGVIESINDADIVIVCPSNPWVSIDPILSIPGIREAISAKQVLAISPIIGGKAVKGPAAKMFSELGITPSALAVAEHYMEFINGFVFDTVDVEYKDMILNYTKKILITNTLMKSKSDRIRLAEEVLDFGKTL